MKFLIHVTCGPENPTKAALACFVARAACDEGHDVTVFFAGDAALLVQPAVADGLAGLGTGRMREHLDALVAAKARVIVSGLSARARGLGEPAAAALPVEFGAPALLVRCAAEADRVLCY